MGLQSMFAFAVFSVVAMPLLVRTTPLRVRVLRPNVDHRSSVAEKRRLSPSLRRNVVSGLGLLVCLLQPDLLIIAFVTSAIVVLHVVGPRLAARKAALLSSIALERAAIVLVDLLRSATSAGVPARDVVASLQSNETISELTAMDEALRNVRAELSSGRRLIDSLQPIRELGIWYEHLVDAVIASERYGTALGGTLDLLAADARTVRRRRLETAARRLPVTMLFPLVVCVLPAFALLTVVPLFVSGFSTLRW